MGNAQQRRCRRAEDLFFVHDDSNTFGRLAVEALRTEVVSRTA
jgi:hypothetical protein